jgi:hypothetical protein
MLKRGFGEPVARPVPDAGPRALPDFETERYLRPLYLLSTVTCRWSTVIEASFAVDDAPWLGELSTALSSELSTHTLCLMVHDDDVLLMNLDRGGESLDGYNSNPQYFENARLSAAEIEEQRHAVTPFEPLLAPGRSLQELRQLLDAGWWEACNAGKLDADGVPAEPWPFDSEAERMSRLADLLDVAGEGRPYPYADWMSSSAVRWREFVALQYQALGHAG